MHLVRTDISRGFQDAEKYIKGYENDTDSNWYPVSSIIAMDFTHLFSPRLCSRLYLLDAIFLDVE